MKSPSRWMELALATSLSLGSAVSIAHAQAQPEPAAPDAAGTPPAETPPAAVVAPPPPAAPGQLKMELPNGTSIRFGLLVQPQYQVKGEVNLTGNAENFYIRRTRILIGGSVLGKFDYFFDTDFPNIGLASNVAGMAGAANTTTKATPGMNVQDIFVTWKAFGDEFKLDVGYMLPSLTHNALQGAGTLYGWDYFAYSFLHSAATTNAFGQNAINPVGRDVGVQARGLVLGGMVEYRAGLFQGFRNAQTTEVNSSNAPRMVGRVQVNLMDAEPGFFYAGTYFGKKKIASLGASIDFQKAPGSSSFSNAYHALGLDGFADMPLPGFPGVLTAQVDYVNWNGGTIVAGLPKNTLVSEAGVNFTEFKLSPIVRYERRWGTVATQNRIAVGGAFWPFEHTINVKLFYTRIQETGAPHGANQVNAQLQLYFF